MTLGLGRRIGFTVAAVFFYAVGTHVPPPAIRLAAWRNGMSEPLTSYL
jgi:hypothetical protein